MENFEKCTVAMLGGPCSQHVTGNTSRQNQPQSAIIKDSSNSHIIETEVSVMWEFEESFRLQLQLPSPSLHSTCFVWHWWCWLLSLETPDPTYPACHYVEHVFKTWFSTKMVLLFWKDTESKTFILKNLYATYLKTNDHVLWDVFVEGLGPSPCEVSRVTSQFWREIHENCSVLEVCRVLR